MGVGRVWSRIAVWRHLSDAALVESSGTGSRPSHLEVCDRCRARADALGALADEVGAWMVRAADAAFPPERLAAQRAHVMHRLERLGHPARIIAFPAVSRPPATRRPRTHRWVAAAAAAGVLVGVLAGLAVDLRRARLASPDPPPEAVAQLVAVDPDRPRLGVDPSGLNDELFLRELETVAVRPRVEALQALDALTPHVREVRVSLVR